MTCLRLSPKLWDHFARTAHKPGFDWMLNNLSLTHLHGGALGQVDGGLCLYEVRQRHEGRLGVYLSSG